MQNVVMRYMQALDEDNASILTECPTVRKKAEAEIANCSTGISGIEGQYGSDV